MRTEQEVINQFLTFAQGHDAIRAAVMNGSRVNPNAPQDLFCDYDIACYVTKPRPFKENQDWIPYFGNLVMLQQNDFVDRNLEGHIFLMIFADGVRIDLSFNPLTNLAYVAEDTLTVVLLDKDGRVPPLPAPSDAGYHTARPAEKLFAETTNEIFWCASNVSKGIWRDELPYVKAMFDEIIRPCIRQMLGWYAASRHSWQIDTGKFGKWLNRYLPGEIWQSYVRTYPGVDYAEIWQALFETLRLTRQIGFELAEKLGYTYPLEDDLRMTAFLQQVRQLPSDALSFDQ